MSHSRNISDYFKVIAILFVVPLLLLSGCQDSIKETNGTEVTAIPAQNREESAAATAAVTAVKAMDIESRLFIEKLDKDSDETIRYVHQDSPGNITVDRIYDGYFTDSGSPELLVIFKLLKVPHAGGLDCSVAAVYDRETLDIISQKTFPYDECKFTILTDDKQKSYLLFIGSTSYQGNSQYTLGLWKPGKTWDLLFPAGSSYMDNKRFDLKDNGVIWVSHPVYDTSGALPTPDIKWLHEYNLVWNKTMNNLEKVIPETYKDADGNMNVDAVSISPNGKYAISTIHDGCEVLVYDTVKNTLSAHFELLAQEYGFLWSADSSKVCVTRAARIWKEVSIIDAEAGKMIEFPSVAEIINIFKEKGAKIDYTLNENRPDPYLTPMEWSPDNNKLLIFYQWTDTNYNRQSGTFVFHTHSGTISRIVQNKVDREHDNLQAKKPVGFKW